MTTFSELISTMTAKELYTQAYRDRRQVSSGRLAVATFENRYATSEATAKMSVTATSSFVSKKRQPKQWNNVKAFKKWLDGRREYALANWY